MRVRPDSLGTDTSFVLDSYPAYPISSRRSVDPETVSITLLCDRPRPWRFVDVSLIADTTKTKKPEEKARVKIVSMHEARGRARRARVERQSIEVAVKIRMQ